MSNQIPIIMFEESSNLINMRVGNSADSHMGVSQDPKRLFVDVLREYGMNNRYQSVIYIAPAAFFGASAATRGAPIYAPPPPA